MQGISLVRFCCTVVLGFLLAGVGKVGAEERSVTDKTGCRVAINAFDTSDEEAIRNIAVYIKATMLDQERRTGSHVISRQNASGQRTSVAVAVTYCRQSPTHTIRKAAIDAFEGFRALSQELGQE